MNEKSVSKQQQKFFGIVRGLQTGKIKDASPEAKKAAATMSKKDVKDFAATKHKGLPKMKESLPSKDEACWDTHKQVGMKKKGGKMVPNCVPEKVEEKVNEVAPLVGLAVRGVAKAADKFRSKEKKENVSSADRKPEVYTKADGKRGVRMVKVDREIVKKETEESFRYRPDPFKSRVSLAKSAKYKEAEAEYQKDKEFARKKAQQKNVKKEKKDISVADYKKKTGKKTVSLKHLTKNTHIDPFKEGYIGGKGEKGRDYHNAGTFDKDTAHGHAKKHNGVVHKDPSGKYLVKHGRGKHVGEEREADKAFTTFIAELTDKQRAEIAKRKAANQAKRGARRGPSKGTKSSEGDWTADQQKSAKALSFEIGKNDKHDAVHKTLAKAADASHPSLGGRKVKVKINGKSKEMAHKDLQHAVDLHKRLPLGKKAAVMNLIRDKGHEGVTAAANHFRKTYK